MDADVMQAQYLLEDEKLLWDAMRARATNNGESLQLSLPDSYKWLLLREITNHRASADSLRRRLIELCRIEREAAQKSPEVPSGQ